ncbi:HECT domain protein [Aspergillus melleus]|uniref:HECT domain protein n=1 Tax=Aspergillus melleus TaxID=138277 RepID=UPI001E8E575E|nr:uncharacterized protein LDX57_005363 [Aspergillus melleus]KAH8427651.1 hypothetical protein LDX57_005363 [Aspergillus melleus]
MTRLRGASVSSYETSRGSIDRPQHRSKLPPNAPEIIAQNTVDVSDPAQVLLWYKDERRRHFNLLVRRYKNQLLYGCQDPGCQTATCASYRRRVTEGPFRRYTELSARTLACYLASLDNAESGLCRNSPRVPSDLSSQDSHQRRSKRRTRALPTNDTCRDRSGSSAAGHNVPKGTSPQTPSTRNADLSGVKSNASRNSSEFEPQKHSEYLPLDESGTIQQMKDPKSFTQNLFDTLSLRMIEWLPLRRSPSSICPEQDQTSARTAARSPKPDIRHAQVQSDTEKQSKGRDRPSQYHALPGGHPHTPSSRATGTQTAAVEVRMANQQFKRRSLTEMDQWRHSPRSSLEDKTLTELKPARKLSFNAHTSTDESVNIPSPPALKHRSQKHRGRTGDTPGGASLEQRKKERRVSWDGAKLLNDAQYYDAQKPTAAIAERQRALEEAQSPSEHKPRPKGVHSKRESSTIQSVTHLTGEIIDGLRQLMVLSEDDAERWKDELAYIESIGTLEDSEWRFATPRQRQVFAFVAQSIFYALGSTKHILQSFRQPTAGPTEMVEQDTVHPRIHMQQLQPSLRKLYSICPKDLIFHSLWAGLETLFIPPRELSTPSKPSRRSSYNSTSGASLSAPIISRQTTETSRSEPISDANAADIATVALFALASSLPEIDEPTWRGLLQMRATGAVASSSEMQKLPLHNTRLIIGITDVLEHELALRLLGRLVRALTARLAFYEISKARQPYTSDAPKQQRSSVLDLLINNLSENHESSTANLNDSDQAQPPNPPAIIAEWLRTLFLKEWDGNPEMPKSSTVGGAVQILSMMYKERSRLGLVPEDFHTPFLSERLEPLELPVEWMGRVPNNKTMHLLSYPFLFPPSALVIYFRALNYAAMSKHYEAATTITRHVTQTAFGAIQIQEDVPLLSRLKTSMTTYLVLVVRRDSLLTDALNQLWRRERRELMRPLKVQLGLEEGEEGLDHGGVQQEFFRLVMAEVMDPCYGMFTTDGRTRVSWFQPCSLEPLYKFELLGLLVSIAVYNGLTLPINFPTAFYRKLLGLKVKHLEHIQDGWPELTKGLEGLLDWDDGDVGDIFMRTYEYSFEAFGSVETVDMQKVGKDSPWPLPSALFRAGSATNRPFPPPWSDVRRFTDRMSLSPPSSMAAEATDSHADLAKSVDGSVPVQSPTPPAEEAPLVTNENRAQFVKDYIFWLTDKSIRPQYEAFAQGFYTCLDRAALSIFTPEALKTVVEGYQEIDVTELEGHARYEGGFGPNHRTIRDFWSVVRGYSAAQKAQLLEFVTASDRVPVNGIPSIMFVIQKNGVGDTRLPTSLTCFGRLLLPEYSSKSVLEEKLSKALENARGFGVA